jgi:two-component system nitrogen regulation response regulator NtrX
VEARSRRGLRARPGAAAAGTLQEARARSERDFILSKLRENFWNVSRTAAAIGIERSHLHRKMKTLNIAAPADRKGA